MLHPIVFNTSQVCYQLGIRHAVMSPGSRNAPIIISFARYREISKWIIPDERSAAFIALGIAQERKEPVVLCCTSGTALLNYAPAIAEAYYREIPLIVLSADRPPELIDQRDGQSIKQFEALKNYVKASFQLPVIESEKSAGIYQRDLIKGIQDSLLLPRGPIHLNIPFREPFYPESGDDLCFQEIPIYPPKVEVDIHPEIDGEKLPNILILIGQQHPHPEIDPLLKILSRKIPIISTPLNNIQTGIDHVDAFIDDRNELKADLLITSGLSVLSKKLKDFLRKQTPKKHLHFDPSGVDVDTFQSSPELIRQDIKSFLPKLNNATVNEEYLTKWESLSRTANEAIEDFIITGEYSETTASHYIFNKIPRGSYLHLSNSMPVRFADFFGIPKGVRVFGNRGAGGIDGCTSTAFGTSLVSDTFNLLVTGDLAFLYDRNAFFHNYNVPNLRIILMNNAGGGIFRLIDGPSQLPELEQYFETRHSRTAEYICAENRLEYISIRNKHQLTHELSEFWKSSNTVKVMEVFTDPVINQRVYKELKAYVHEYINN